MKPGEAGGENEEGEAGGAEESADDDEGEGALDFAAGAVGEEEGEESESGGEGGHEDGSEAAGGGFDGGGRGVHAALDELAGAGDEDESVAEGDAEEGDESDGGGNGEVFAAEPEGGDAADEGEGDVEEDEEGVADGIKGGVNHEEDEEEGKGDDEGEALVGFLLEFVGAAPGGEVTGGEVYFCGDGFFGFGDEAADVASGDVGLNGDEALAVFAGDLPGTDKGFEGGDFVEGDEDAFGAADDGFADGAVGVTVCGRVADEDVEAADALEDESGGGAADAGLNNVLDVGEVEVVTGGGGAVDLDKELGGTGDLIDLDVAGAGDFGEDVGNLVGVLEEGVEVFAEEFEGEFGLYAFEEFIDGHFDGLGVVDDDAGWCADGLAECFDHGVAVVGCVPFLGRGHDEVEFGGVDGVGMGTDFAASDAGDDFVDFLNFKEAAFDGLSHLLGGLDGDRGGELEFDDHGAFVEFGGELATEAGEE